MKTSSKARITITLDLALVETFLRLKKERHIKTSPYINKVMRRHFLRPGKGMEQYSLGGKAAE